jgi:hypothetical protein
MTFDRPEGYLSRTVNNKTKLIGWYPPVDAGDGPSVWNVDNSGAATVSFTVDGKTDILLSNLVEGDKDHRFDGLNNNSMVFNHLLTRLAVRVFVRSADLANGWGKVKSVTIRDKAQTCVVRLPGVEAPGNTHPDPATFTGNGTLPLIYENPGVDVTIPAISGDKDTDGSLKGTALVGTAMVAPGMDADADANRITLDVVCENKEASVVVPAPDGKFNVGKSYTLTLEFLPTEVVLQANTIHDWGYKPSDYLLTATQTVFNLTAFGGAVSGEALRVDFLTTAPGQPTCTTSLQSDTETSVKPDWITPVLSSGTAFNGWTSYTLTFSATDNFSTSRTGYILVRVSGLTFAVTVNQVSEALFLDRVDPTGEDIALPFTAGSGSFAVATNSWQAPAIKYSTDGMLANATDNAPNWFTKGGTSSFAYTGGGKTGIQYTTAYSYTKNTDMQNARVLYIHVLVNGDANTALSFKVTQAKGEITVVADGMTNCYMMKPNEMFEFPVVRAYKYKNGAFTDELRIGGMYTGSFYTKVIWEDVTDLVPTSSVFYDGKDSKIFLRVAAGKTGNALIGLYKSSDSELVWSWHIWVTDYTGDNTWTNNGYTLMDRNLGATDNGINSVAQVRASHGLLYQWGRKDPIPNGLNGAAGYSAINQFYGIPFQGAKDNSKFSLDNQSLDEAIISSIKHPTTYYDTYMDQDWLPVGEGLLWTDENGNKTIYDPCPAGWRVPGRTPLSHGLIILEDTPWYNSGNWTRTVYDGRVVAWAPNDVNNNSMLIETPTIYGWNGVDYTRGRYWLGHGRRSNERVANAWYLMDWMLGLREKNEANAVRCAKEDTP